MSTIDLPTIRQRIDVDSSALGGLKSKMGGLASTLGKGVAVGAGIAAAGVGAFVAKGVSGAVEVERGVREVVTLFGETGEAANAMTAELSAGVADLSQEVGLAQSEITSGLYSAISAGVPRDNAFEFMRVASEASIAGVTDVETAVDGLTTTINAFGLDASQAQDVADSMFAAVQGGKTTFEELSASLFNVAPAAAGLGVGFDEVNAALATLTASGTPTSVATTQMRAALAELGKSGTKAGDAFAEIAGTTFPEFVAQGGTLQEALAMMGEAAGGNATELQNMFGSVEAGQAAAQLGVTNLAKFTDELERQEGAAGAAGDAYETMDQSTDRALERLRVTFDNLATEVGGRLLPVIADAARWLGERLPGWIDAARPYVESFIEGISRVAETVGPILETVGEAIGQIWTILVERDFTGGPFAEDSPLIGGIFAVRDAFVTVRDVISSVISAIVERFSGGADGMGATGGKISEIFGKVGEVVSRIGETIALVASWIAEVWERYGAQLVEYVTTSFGNLVSIIGGALDVIIGIFDVVLGILTGDWSRAWDGIKSIVSGVWEAIKALVSQAINVVSTVIGGTLAVIAAIFADTWASIVDGISGAWDTITGAVASGVEGIRDKGREALEWFRELPGRILGALGDVGTMLLDAGRQIIGGLINGITDRIDGIRDAMGDVASAIGRFLPGSPVAEGPLTKLNRGGAGREISRMIAGGIRAEEDAVARASSSLAATIERNLPSSLGLDPSSVGTVRTAELERRRRSEPDARGLLEGGAAFRDLIVHNPTAEPAEESVDRQLRKLASLGVL